MNFEEVVGAPDPRGSGYLAPGLAAKSINLEGEPLFSYRFNLRLIADEVENARGFGTSASRTRRIIGLFEDPGANRRPLR